MANNFYVSSNEDAREGLLFIRKGKAGKLKDAEYVIQTAGDKYSSALSGLTEPKADASKQEVTAYHKTQRLITNLGTEIASYTREQANELAKTADKYVSGIRSDVKHEERGRKVLGVPYAKRPSASYVAGKIDEVTNYISEAQGRLEAMRKTLADQRISGPADVNMIKTVKDRLENAFRDVAALEVKHSAITPTTGKVVGFVKKTPGYVKDAAVHVGSAAKHVAGAAGSVGGYIKGKAHLPHLHIGGGAKTGKKTKKAKKIDRHDKERSTRWV